MAEISAEESPAGRSIFLDVRAYFELIIKTFFSFHTEGEPCIFVSLFPRYFVELIKPVSWPVLRLPFARQIRSFGCATHLID